MRLGEETIGLGVGGGGGVSPNGRKWETEEVDGGK